MKYRLFLPMDEIKNRKTTRLKNYNYNNPGYYFITFCTEDKKKVLCNIVGTGVLDGPEIILTDYGKIADHYLQNMSHFYDGLILEKYVIMPIHIHLLIQITSNVADVCKPNDSQISRFVGTFKRLCNKEYGCNIWQYRSHDHIIRGEKDYQKIWAYIDQNPYMWANDCFYTE